MCMSSASSLAAQILGAGWGWGQLLSPSGSPGESKGACSMSTCCQQPLDFCFGVQCPRGLPCLWKNRESLRTSETLISCCVTSMLCHVPCVSCADKRIDTWRAAAQMSSFGCLCASPSIMHFHSNFWWGSWADLLAVSSMDSVAPFECLASRSGWMQVFGLTVLLHISVWCPQTALPLPASSPSQGQHRLCERASVAQHVFKLCHLLLFTVKPFIFSMACIPGLALEPLETGYE